MSHDCDATRMVGACVCVRVRVCVCVCVCLRNPILVMKAKFAPGTSTETISFLRHNER